MLHKQVLYQWLTARPDYEEVTRWYLNWKELFPAQLAAQVPALHSCIIPVGLASQMHSHGACLGALSLPIGIFLALDYLRVFLALDYLASRCSPCTRLPKYFQDS